MLGAAIAYLCAIAISLRVPASGHDSVTLIGGMLIFKAIKRCIRQAVYNGGYMIEPRRYSAVIAMAERLKRIFADYSIDTVIDVGANEGQYGAFLRERVGFKGKIESFEPIPVVAQRLRRKASAGGHWSVHQLAVGAQSGRKLMNVTSNTTMSSFHTLTDDYQRVIAVAEKLEVEMTTIDEFFSGRDLSRTYLKLDTQGFDLEVLKGGARSIATFPALQTEISFRPFYDGMPNYQESLDAFGRYGFCVADFFLAASDGRHAAMEFDCIMIRTP